MERRFQMLVFIVAAMAIYVIFIVYETVDVYMEVRPIGNHHFYPKVHFNNLLYCTIKLICTLNITALLGVTIYSLGHTTQCPQPRTPFHFEPSFHVKLS